MRSGGSPRNPWVAGVPAPAVGGNRRQVLRHCGLPRLCGPAARGSSQRPISTNLNQFRPIRTNFDYPPRGGAGCGRRRAARRRETEVILPAIQERRSEGGGRIRKCLRRVFIHKGQARDGAPAAGFRFSDFGASDSREAPALADFVNRGGRRSSGVAFGLAFRARRRLVWTNAWMAETATLLRRRRRRRRDR